LLKTKLFLPFIAFLNIDVHQHTADILYHTEYKQ